MIRPKPMRVVSGDTLDSQRQFTSLCAIESDAAPCAFAAAVLHASVIMKAASLRDRQRQEAIQEIVDAAFDLFELHGYNNTTIRRIADRVGIAPRTFFRYFARKEDVVFGDQESIIARLRAGLAEIGGEGSPVPAVTRVILTVQDPASNARRELTRAQLRQQVPAVRARGLRLVEALEEEVATTLLRHLPEPHRQMAIARMIAGAIFGSLRGARRTAGEERQAEPAVLVKAALNIAEHGASAYFLPDPE